MSNVASEIHPNDSASVVNEEEDGSELQSKAGRQSGTAVNSTVASTLPHDDGTYLFKFNSPSGTTHRFVARYDQFSTVKDIIGGKLASDPFFTQHAGTPNGAPLDPNDFSISYTDDDGDLVLLSSDHDLDDSVKTARKQGRDRVLLIVKGGRGWEDAIANAYELQKEKKRTLKVVHEDDELGDDVTRDDIDPEGHDPRIASTKKKASTTAGSTSSSGGGKRSSSSSDDELVFGVLPRDMLLPAAVAFLGVAVIGVFAMSRSSK